MFDAYDTTGAYASSQEPGNGDRELLAQIEELAALIANKDLWKQDFAQPNGIRWGVLPWPLDKPQWTFRPILNPGKFPPIYGEGTPELPPNLITKLTDLQ